MSKNIAVFPKLNADIYSAICFESSDIYSTEINSRKVPLQQSVAKDDNREIVLLNPENEPWSLLDKGPRAVPAGGSGTDTAHPPAPANRPVSPAREPHRDS